MTTENGETKIATETLLGPVLPICDAHHHLWERHPKNYLLEDLLDDLNSASKNLASIVACLKVIFPVETLSNSYVVLWNAFNPDSAGPADAMSEEQPFHSEVNGSLPLSGHRSVGLTAESGFKRITAHYAAAERAALFHDTATRIYRTSSSA